MSNTVAVVPDINGTNFSINVFAVGMGTQTVVAAIRDQAGHVGYATNQVFLTVVTNGAYQYSAAGCVTNIAYRGTQYAQTTKFGWNSQYQLTSVSSATVVVEYSYDVLGRRTSISDGTNTINMIYDGDQVAADVDTNGAVLRTYVWGAGIDNLLSFTDYTSSNTYYAIKDVQNTVHALVDATGQIVERYEYDAWGRTTVFDAAGDELTESAVGNRYLWQGREYDSTTKLYYFRARWYDPVVGRWLSKDPIGISGGLNMYVFCANNPLNFVDPLGLCSNDSDDEAGPILPIGKKTPPKNWPDPGGKWKWDPSSGKLKKGGRYRNWHEDETHNGHWDDTDKNGNDHQNIYPYSGLNINWGTVGAVGVTVVGGGIIVVDILTVPSGEGLIGVGLIKAAWGY